MSARQTVDVRIERAFQPSSPGAVPCLRCGYDLRGNAPGGRCPECDYGVERTLRGIEPDVGLRFLYAVATPIKAGSVFFAFAFTLFGIGLAFAAGMGEPFYRHVDWDHLLTYVAVPSAALVVWLAWVALLVFLVYRRVLRWPWLVLVLWTLFPLLLMFAGMDRYVRDITEMASWNPMPP